ncbi:MAG: SPOR domain-containing protein [Burkholderiaceae bacterium]|nr:SPOR domain-containing protein [Burkholderiaceae bacterium]
MTKTLRASRTSARQGGGFLLGLVVGLLIGLALALGVALYVTKVPVPFLDKVPQRTQEQDAAEREKNKNWDPNAPLAGKNPAKPVVPASAASAPIAGAIPPVSTRDPASILADQPSNAPTPVSTKAGDEAFTYFVQTGAYTSADDAESQRGKLALLGYAARVTEREQSGRTVHRVRLGPFEEKVEADSTKEKLVAAGFDSVLVRAPK